MTKQEFADKVMEIYNNNNYTIMEAVEATKKELGISVSEADEYLGRDKSHGTI